MNASVRNFIGISLLFLTHGNIVWALKNATPLEMEIVYREGHRSLPVAIVLDASLEKSAELLRKQSLEALSIAEKSLGMKFREKFWIYFDSRPDYHNGLTTVIPNNRIYVHSESPDIEESIGLGKDYLLETLVHEMGHMLSMQQRSGIFAFLDSIVGNTSRPNASWPRWIHEGSAVWAESAVGGRPASGFMDLDLRRYAEYFRRNKTQALENSDLDGSRDNHGSEAGSYPYHFGYLLLKKWANLSSQDYFGSFALPSSSNLGISFRPIFRSQGRSLEDSFALAQEDWTSTPLLPPQNYEVLRRAKKIQGPFSSEPVTWIEEESSDKSPGAFVDKKLLVASINKYTTLESSWKYSSQAPLQNFWLNDKKHWIVLVRSQARDSNHDARRFVWELDSSGSKICEWKLPTRLREIFYKDGILSWIRTDAQGFAYAEKTELQGVCEGGPQFSLTQSREAFERLSNIYADKKTWMLSRSQGRNSFEEYLEIEGQKEVHASFPVTQVLPFSSEECPEATCWLVQQMNSDYWGPLILNVKEKTFRRLALPTGSTKSALSPEGFWVKEKLWEEDRMLFVSNTQWEEPQALTLNIQEKLPGNTRPENSTNENATGEKVSDDFRPYNALPSLWPHFWIPSLGAANGGFIIMGETFYEDLSRLWGGFTQLGYDSSLGSPFFVTDLDRKRIDFLGPFSQAHLMTYYVPALLFGFTQKRWGASLGLDSFWKLGDSWTLSVSPALTYLGGAQAPFPLLTSYQKLSPALSTVLHSSEAQRPFETLFRLPFGKTGLMYSQTSRWIQGLDTYQSINFHFPILRTLIQSHIEYGWTDPSNFPITYFESGGEPSFSTQNQNFLDRGFPLNFIVAPSLLRMNAELGYKLLNFKNSLSWNRGHLTALEHRVIFETMTWKSFLENSRFALGRQYFSTLGMEVDLSGQVFHYVLFKCSLGLFHGFGPYGENQISLNIRSFLDL